ncbi:Calmodulin-regulated spectrin-associated protein 3 [Geranomyces variabilis]|nr:Calmodulin-regulated spectrin-associated protein 3 [Geranomyces variabilis]
MDNNNTPDEPPHSPQIQWVQEHLGFDALSYNDISEGFALLQILSLISASATDLSWYSSSAAFECDDISARIYTDVAKGLREVGISFDEVSEEVIAGVRSGDEAACDELLSALRTRYEALHGPPAAADCALPPTQDVSDTLSLHNDYDSEWYEVAEPSFKPAVRWTLLFAKQQSDISSQSLKAIDEALLDLDRQKGKLIPRAKLIPFLCSGNLYAAVASQIFGETSPEYLDHLTTHGYLKFKSSLRDSISDMIADDTPFYESIHCNLMEALISASCRNVGIGNIVDHIRRRFPSFNIAALYPYDLEDALLIWSNQCLAQLRKEATNALSSSSPLAQAMCDTPDVDELGPGFSDGRVFCLIVCLYLPNACERHMHHVLTPESRLANWSAFTSVGHDQPDIDVTWSAHELASAEHASPGSTGAVRLIYMSIVCQLFCAFQHGDGPDSRAAIEMLEASLAQWNKKAVKAESAIRNSGNEFLQKTSSRKELLTPSKRVVKDGGDEILQPGPAVVPAVSQKKTPGGKPSKRKAKAKEPLQTSISEAEPATNHDDELSEETSSAVSQKVVKSAAHHGDESTKETLSTVDRKGKVASDQSNALSKGTPSTRSRKVAKSAAHHDDKLTNETPSTDNRKIKAATHQSDELSTETSSPHISQVEPAHEQLKETSRTRSPQVESVTHQGKQLSKETPRTRIMKAEPGTHHSDELLKATQKTHLSKAQTSTLQANELPEEPPRPRMSKAEPSAQEPSKETSRTSTPHAESAAHHSGEISKETPRTRVSKVESAPDFSGELSGETSSTDSQKMRSATPHSGERSAETPTTLFLNEESTARHSGGLSKEAPSADNRKLKSACHKGDQPSEESSTIQSWQPEDAAAYHSDGLTLMEPCKEFGNVESVAQHGDSLPEKMSLTRPWRENSATFQPAGLSKKKPSVKSSEDSHTTPGGDRGDAESLTDHSDADDASSDFGLGDMPILSAHRASSVAEAPVMPMMSVFPEIVTSSLGSSRKLHGVSTRDLTSTPHVAPAAVRLPDIATVPPPVALPDRNCEIPTSDRIWSATKRSRPASAKSLRSTSVWVAAPVAQVNVNSAGTRVADPFSDEEGWSTEEDPDDAQDAEEADSVTDEAEWETDEEAQVQEETRATMPTQTPDTTGKEAPAPTLPKAVMRRPTPHRRSAASTPQFSVSRLSPSPPVANTPPAVTQKQPTAPSASTTRPASAVQIAPAAEPSRQRNASHSAASRTRRPATGLRQYPLEESDSEDCGAEKYPIRHQLAQKSPDHLPAALCQGPSADADSTDSSDDEDYAIRKPVEVTQASQMAPSDQKGTVVSSIRVVNPRNEVTGTAIAPAVTTPSANPSISEVKDLKQVQKPAERLQEIKTRKAETIRRMEAAREQELQRIALQKQEDAKKKDEAKRIRLLEQSQKLEERAKQIADERAKLKKDQERAASSPTSTAGAATPRRASKSNVRPNVKEQSNRQLIRNALVHVCLAGSVNEKCQEEVLEVCRNIYYDSRVTHQPLTIRIHCCRQKDLETTPSNHFIILFHAPSTQTFRGLYSYDPRLDQALKIHPGTQGPDVLDTANVLTFYKYDSGARIFKPVPTKSFGRSVHAVAIGREWASKGKEKAAAKFKPKELVKSAVTC